jgi:DNA-binding transcriptional LysR family regulator
MLAATYANVNSLRMFAWDDLKVFLALYRERTTGRAAKELGISQPTVVRRLAALEQATGLKLFERQSSGLVPTTGARQLISAAKRAERGMCEFTAEVESLTETGLKVIKLTLLDHFEQLMVPVLRSFRERWPALHIELLPTDHIYDLARGEADIAVRGRDRPAGEELVVRDLPPCGFAVYAAADQPPENRPRSAEELKDYPLAFLDAPPNQLPIYQWIRSHIPPGTVAPRCRSFQALSSSIASGAVVGALPCTMGDSNPLLVRCLGPVEEFDVPIYLVARRAVLRRPPARDLFEAIHSYFSERPSLMMGKRD